MNTENGYVVYHGKYYLESQDKHWAHFMPIDISDTEQTGCVMGYLAGVVQPRRRKLPINTAKAG